MCDIAITIIPKIPSTHITGLILDKEVLAIIEFI